MNMGHQLHLNPRKSFLTSEQTPILEPVLKPVPPPPQLYNFLQFYSPTPRSLQGSVIYIFLEGFEFYWVGRRVENY